MARSAFLQSSFLGGEWSNSYNGRVDDQRYVTAMQTCLNIIPVEQGAACRRPGTANGAYTRAGVPAKIVSFPFDNDNPYNLEFTDGHLRLWSKQQLVTYVPLEIQSINSASPSQVATVDPHGFSTGDQVIFFFSGAISTAQAALYHTVCSVQVINAYLFNILDGVTLQPISVNISSSGMTVGKVVDFSTPYTGGSWSTIQCVFDDQSAIILCQGYPPYLLTAVIGTGIVNSTYFFTYAPFQFYDGPYLDPDQSTTVTVSAHAPNTTVFATFASIANINNGEGFLPTDIGRWIRILVEPPAYNPTTAYAAGLCVSYPAQAAKTNYATAYYTNSSGTTLTGVIPINSPSSVVTVTVGSTATSNTLTDWELYFMWPAYIVGTISSVVNSNEIEISILEDSTNGFYSVFSTYQLGVYTNTPNLDGKAVWPTSGVYHEGRLWLGGAVVNRFDASMSNLINQFSLSNAVDASVNDNNAISYTLNSSDANEIVWMLPDQNGIIMGTKAGEWLVQASTLSEPLTPTSIQAHRVTKIGCAPVLPVRTGISIAFIQKYKRRVMEFLSDVFTGRYIAPNLSEAAQHLSISGLEELSYQEETTPIIWARCGSGSLIGATYRRVSTFISEVPKFIGWHRHALGSGNGVISISVGPSADGTLDTLALVTQNPITTHCFVEFLTPMFQEGAPVTTAWFLDNAIVPTVQFNNLTQPTALVLGGLTYQNGNTVTAFIAGLDCGDYTVANGQITVPFGADANQMLGIPYLELISSSGLDFGQAAAFEYNSGMTFPVVVGSPFTSQGQILRPILPGPGQSGAQLGPALGVTRRVDQMGVKLVDTQNIYFGTRFEQLYPAYFKSPGGNPYPANQLVTGVFETNIADDNTFDGSLCWQADRCMPATVSAISGFITTNDR
jgi:hypothetical protein